MALERDMSSRCGGPEAGDPERRLRMRRLRSKKTPLAFAISCAVEEKRFIVARAVEMASYDQPVRTNRRAHRLLTGLGKLAEKPQLKSPRP